MRIIHDEGVQLGEAGYPVPSAPVGNILSLKEVHVALIHSINDHEKR